MLTDYFYKENREEEDLLASKTAFRHRYNGSKTTTRTRTDYIHQKQYWQHDGQQKDNN